MEKRQHLFANRIISPLPPSQVGIFGMGRVTELDMQLQKAEDELEKKWSQKGDHHHFSGITGDEGPSIELKGMGIGGSESGREKVL